MNDIASGTALKQTTRLGQALGIRQRAPLKETCLAIFTNAVRADGLKWATIIPYTGGLTLCGKAIKPIMWTSMIQFKDLVYKIQTFIIFQTVNGMNYPLPPQRSQELLAWLFSSRLRKTTWLLMTGEGNNSRGAKHRLHVYFWVRQRHESNVIWEESRNQAFIWFITAMNNWMTTNQSWSYAMLCDIVAMAVIWRTLARRRMDASRLSYVKAYRCRWLAQRWNGDTIYGTGNLQTITNGAVA